MSRLIVIALLIGAVYGAHRLALWAESRGWIYYRTKRMPPGTAGMAAMQVSELFEPEIEHVLEEMTSEAVRADENESGERRRPFPV